MCTLQEGVLLHVLLEHVVGSQASLGCGAIDSPLNPILHQLAVALQAGLVILFQNTTKVCFVPIVKLLLNELEVVFVGIGVCTDSAHQVATHVATDDEVHRAIAIHILHNQVRTVQNAHELLLRGIE